MTDMTRPGRRLVTSDASGLGMLEERERLATLPSPRRMVRYARRARCVRCRMARGDLDAAEQA